MGRVYLFPAYIMFEDKGVMDSLRASWEATDEHGTTLFFLTFVFFVLTLVAGSLMTGVIFDGNPVAGTIGAGFVSMFAFSPGCMSTSVCINHYKTIKETSLKFALQWGFKFDEVSYGTIKEYDVDEVTNINEAISG